MAIDDSKIKKTTRTKKDEEEKVEEDNAAISAGRIEKILDLLYNPTREGIRAVTIIDRFQGRLFPQLDMINMGRKYILEIALFRQNKELYKKTFQRERPIPPDFIEELLYRTAQWGKSVAGKSLERGIDLALAEIEGKVEEEPIPGLGADAYKD